MLLTNGVIWRLVLTLVLALLGFLGVQYFTVTNLNSTNIGLKAIATASEQLNFAWIVVSGILFSFGLATASYARKEYRRLLQF